MKDFYDLNIKTRSYITGVWDSFHYGHLRIFKKIKNYGNFVIAGIHTDDDVMTYKSKPKMKYEFRLEMLEQCKYVDEIIEAPTIVTLKFLDDNDYDFLVCGKEGDMDSMIRKQYSGPDNVNRLIILPRTEGICSSDINYDSMG